MLVWCILDMDCFGGKQKEDRLDFFREGMLEKGKAGEEMLESGFLSK